MITLYFEINNIAAVRSIYDCIEIVRYIGDLVLLSTPVGEPGGLTDWTTVSGIAPYTTPVYLYSNQQSYYVYDEEGNSSDWYSSRYSNSSDPTSINTGWSTPVVGDSIALYQNPLYPSELSMTLVEKTVVDRIRALIGDTVELNRQAGEEAMSKLHPGGKVYELEEKGWPISINMSGIQYSSLDNPIVNGYKYLKFNSDISEPITVSGVVYSIDVWYYTFRHSDKEILYRYNYTPPPPGLTVATATSEAYVITAAIELVRSELLLDATESGARFSDGVDNYDPSPGLQVKQKLLDNLENQLNRIVKSLRLTGITGVRIE